MVRRNLVAVAAVLGLLASGADARGFRRSKTRQHGTGQGALRRKFHIADLITEPGTVEAEWYHTYSLSSESYWIPTLVKITPAEKGSFWGSTEFSVGFDGVDSETSNGDRGTYFSDHVNLNATTVLFSHEHFSLAAGPQATIWLRQDTGARIGGYAIGRWDLGKNNLGLTASWTGATDPSDTNPAGTFDFGAGYGRIFGPRGTHHPITAHMTTVFERSSGFSWFPAFYEGAGVQLTPKVTLDVTGSHLGASGGGYDHQLQAGLIVNFGHPRNWFRR